VRSRSKIEIGQPPRRGRTELGIGLVEVITDRARTEKELPRELTVGGAGGRQADDLEFLGRHPAERIGAYPARRSHPPPAAHCASSRRGNLTRGLVQLLDSNVDVATAHFDGLHVQTPLDDQAVTHDKDRDPAHRER
jgi:hypothetical protein